LHFGLELKPCRIVGGGLVQGDTFVIFLQFVRHEEDVGCPVTVVRRRYRLVMSEESDDTLSQDLVRFTNDLILRVNDFVPLGVGVGTGVDLRSPQ
jgi:hypothetical protein